MQEVIYILRFIIFYIFAPANIIFKKPFHWILNTGNHEKVCAEPLGSNPANGTCIEPVKR